MVFTREQMFDIRDDDEATVSDIIIGHRRWSVDHELVFKHEGKFYRTTYSVGATENQDEGPWEYQNEVECDEVEPVERTITVYEPIKVSQT